MGQTCRHSPGAKAKIAGMSGIVRPHTSRSPRSGITIRRTIRAQVTASVVMRRTLQTEAGTRPGISE